MEFLMSLSTNRGIADQNKRQLRLITLFPYKRSPFARIALNVTAARTSWRSLVTRSSHFPPTPGGGSSRLDSMLRGRGGGGPRAVSAGQLHGAENTAARCRAQVQSIGSPKTEGFQP